MTGNFQEAVRWLTPICQGVVKDRKLLFKETDFSEPYLELKLGIFPIDGGYEVSTQTGRELLYLSQTLPGAYDLACKICSVCVFRNCPMPDGLRLFAAEVLAGMTKRPKGKKKDKTWLANQYKLALIHRVAHDFDLSMTRGDNNPEVSACDAVSHAFQEAGHSVDYFSLKRLCVEKRYGELRKEFSLWAGEATKLSYSFISTQYSLPAHFAPHVADGPSNRDTSSTK